MGKDLNTVICVHRSDGSVRKLSEGLFIDRNRDLFRLLGYGPEPVFDLRGIPDGAHTTLRRSLGENSNGEMDPDWGWHSWLTSSELQELIAVYESLPPREPGVRRQIGLGMAATLGAMEAIDETLGKWEGGHAILAYFFT